MDELANLENPDDSREVGDEEVDDHPKIGTHKQSHRKQKQHSIFDSWFRDQASKTDFSAIKPVPAQENGEHPQTVKEMLRNQESHKIIGKEYEFQIELFDRAKSQNTIVVVDTGAGKTLVAMLLLKHVVNQDIEDRSKGKPRKIAFFVVDKVTLMIQQYYALRANLPFDMEYICGAHKPELWGRGKWKELFEQQDIIVCTAEVLYQCLMRSFVKTEQINLLIFDEAHHAKKDHAYARIMREYYHRDDDDSQKLESRPRIFGMTASPVDIEDASDVEDCARDLEIILDSKIATRNNHDVEVQKSKPDEEVLNYPKSPLRLDTELYHLLKGRYHNLSDFSSLFARAQEINQKLGPWCADNFWTFAFSEKEVKKYTAKAEKLTTDETYKNDRTREKHDKQINDLQAAHEDIQSYKLRPAMATLTDFSPKVLALRECLLRYFERPSDSRCLVFVTRRETARLLKLAFDELGGPHMRCGCLIGSSSRDFDGQRYSYYQQILTIQQFRKGQLNCLFATTVAEEGLDVPDCNLVVRFDPCTTMIQFIQSRGRARHQNSKFVHLIEHDAFEEQDRLALIHESELRMKNFCNALPQDQRLGMDDDDDNDNDEIKGKLNGFPTYMIKSSGARLTYDWSLTVLNHYVSMIPHDEFDDMALKFVIFVRDGKFVAEVNLPERANISPVIGRGHNRKMHAKMSAAFETCKILRSRKLLNEHFLPIYVDQLHHMRNARLAIKSKKQQAFPIQLKPSIWSAHRGSPPTEFYLTTIRLGDGWDRDVRAIGLLTRTKLPSLPQFPLYKLTGEQSMVQSQAYHTAIGADEAMISKLTWFTLTVFKDIYNKKFEEEPKNMSYWLTPLRPDFPLEFDCDHDPSDLLDNDLLSSMHRQGPLKWEPQSPIPNESLVDKFLIDPWDGGRRFFSERIVPDLKPFDAVPGNVATGPKGYTNIVEYSSGLFKKSKERRQWAEEQPVIAAEKILHRLNTLATPNEQEQTAIMQCFVCPEPLDISRLPPDVATIGLLFPAIIHRFESYLIALDFCNELGLSVGPGRALEAVTKDSDNSDDAQAEKVNFQRGMGANYERLEFIGDTFLKMATSLATYLHNAGKDEYWMHVQRMTLLCNKNMFNVAQDRGYPKYIRSQQFSRRTWYPEGLKLLSGKGAGKKSEEPKQDLSEKSIADVCEAMIGAALVSHVETGYEDGACFNDAVKAVSAFVSSEDHEEHNMQEWKDYSKAYNIPKYQTAHPLASEIAIAQKVQQVHDYAFKYIKLLSSAFTHPSCGQAYAKAPSYQRLEFLGDALLDMTAVKHLFHHFPENDPQWMTEHKMAMVSNKFLGALSAKLGFNKFLNHNSMAIRAQVTAFMEEFEEAQRESEGSRNFWEALKDPPKCMADMVESYVGAMFIDSNFNFAEVQRFFDTHVVWFFKDMSIYDNFANSHPINQLNDLITTSMGCKEYRVMAQDNPSDDEYTSVAIAGVLIHSSVIGKGVAKTIRLAKATAATNAYEQLHGMTPFEFRRRFGCGCSGANGMMNAVNEDETHEILN